MNWEVNKSQDTDAGPLLKFLPIIKVEEAPDGTVKMVYGMATAEVPDKDNEICDYADTAPQYKVWSDAIFKATTNAGQEASLGNVRIQHTLEVGGKVVKLDFLEAQKQVHIGTEPKDDKIGSEIKRGFYTGYSQGGRYLYRRCNVCKTNMGSGNFCPECKKNVAVRYAAKIAEVSYVDNPCLGSATFAFVKADGSVELRKFEKVAPAPEAPAPDNSNVLELFTTMKGIQERMEKYGGEDKMGWQKKVAKNSECECSCQACQDGNCDDCPGCDDPNCTCNSEKVSTAQDLNRVLQPILQRLEARST